METKCEMYKVTVENYNYFDLDSTKTHYFVNKENAEQYLKKEQEDCSGEIEQQSDCLILTPSEGDWHYVYRMQEMPDRILCAAVHFHCSKSSESLPLNIKEGIVVAGRRHSDCLTPILALGFASLLEDKTDGFITASNLFLDREAAFKVAKEGGQLLSFVDREADLLISEMLYLD
jgi:hypothetical protein